VATLTVNKFLIRVIGWICITITCYLAVLSGARCGPFGCIVGFVVVSGLSVLFLRERRRILFRIVALVLAGVVMLLIQPIKISDKIQGRYEEVAKSGLKSPNIAGRIELFRASFNHAIEGGETPGFGKLWRSNRIDEANFWVALLNGVGLTGFFSYTVGFLIIGLLVIRNLKSSDERAKAMNIAAIGTYLATCLTSNSSDQILYEVSTVVPFWFLMGIALKAKHLADLEKRSLKEIR
jgi:hypothetical protein